MESFGYLRKITVLIRPVSHQPVKASLIQLLITVLLKEEQKTGEQRSFSIQIGVGYGKVLNKNNGR